MRFIQPITATTAAIAVIAATCAIGIARLIGGTAPAVPVPPRFAITELTVPDDAESAEAVAFNDTGQVVVTWYPPPNDKTWFGLLNSTSFVWERGKEPRILGKLGKTGHLQPHAINNAGQIVGISWDENDHNLHKRRAFLWEKGKPRDLGTPKGETSEAFAINNRSEVFLTSYAFGDKSNPKNITKTGAFLWSAAKGLRALPDGFNGHGAACALNDRGQIAGTRSITAAERRDSENFPDMHESIPWCAFLYTDPEFQRLLIERSWSTQAEALNNRGDVLLSAYVRGKETVGNHQVTVTQPGGLYLWRDGRATHIITNSDTPEPDVVVVASLNDAGDVVTTIYRGLGKNRQYKAALYRNGTLYSLDDCIPESSGWHLTSARQINNRGEIIGQGVYQGKKRAFLLTPP